MRIAADPEDWREKIEVAPGGSGRPTRARSGFALIELLVVIAIIGVLAALIFPALAHAKKKAQVARCASNLGQLGIAVRLYADSNDGRMPLPDSSNGGLRGLLMGWVEGKPGVFHCPADRRTPTDHGGISYHWSSAYNGRLIDRVSRDSPENAVADSPMLSDLQEWHGARNGLFPDGRVERLSKRLLR